MLLTALVDPALFKSAAAAFDLGTPLRIPLVDSVLHKARGVCREGDERGEVCFVLKGFFFFLNQTSLNSHLASL